MDDQEINEISNAILEKLMPFIDEKFKSIEKGLDQISADIESIREYLNLERSKYTGRVMPYEKHYVDYGVLYRPDDD